METGSDVVDTTKILEKGPEYLRKQMELLESEAKGGMSAVERLAATKPKYVKSPQVVNSTQEPALSFGSAASLSSDGGSSNRSGSNRGGKQAGAERSSPLVSAAAQSRSPEPPENNVVRRSSSKKRPDSLLLYRQKCDLLKGSAAANGRHRRNLTRRLLLAGSSADKSAASPEATGKECKSEDNNNTRPATRGGSRRDLASQTRHLLTEIPQENEVIERRGGTEDPGPATTDVTTAQKPGHRRVAEVQRRCRKGVSRSHSDVSSRYSKNFADFDAFFNFCGLDGAVVDSLGKEGFAARSDDLTEQKVRSVSSASTASDGGFSRNSEDSDGLLELELRGNAGQGTSVIERNARVIKWLYSCRNAKETGKKLRDLD